MCFSTSLSSSTPFRRLRSRTRTSHSQPLIVFWLLLPVAIVRSSSVHASLADGERFRLVIVVAIGAMHVLVRLVELRSRALDLVVGGRADVADGHVVAE